MSDVSPNRCSTGGSSRNASETERKLESPPHITSRSSVERVMERARSQARIAAIVTTAMTSVARAKCQRWRRRDTEYTAVTPPRAATGANGACSSPTAVIVTASTSVNTSAGRFSSSEATTSGASASGTVNSDSPRMLTSASVTVITTAVSRVNMASIALSR